MTTLQATSNGARRIVAGLLGLFMVTQATAHDFWIEPASFSPPPGQKVDVHLYVGEHFQGDALGRPPTAGMHRFVVVDTQSNTSLTLPGRAYANPAGLFRADRAGAYIIGFHGKPSAVELPAEKFNVYLKDEGLDSVFALRAARGQSNEVGREIYSRCAKSLVRVGDNPGGQVDRVLGFPLELVAEPASIASTDTVPVRLLHEGRPLAGALVVAIHRNDAHRRIALRTDAEGRVVLTLARDGQWLIKAVHMKPAPLASGADWESLWASLSLSLAPTQ